MLSRDRETKPPTGDIWLHEIKHDGFRLIAGKTDKGVRLYSRPGNDLTQRFALLAEAIAVRSILEAFNIAPQRDTKRWTDQQLDEALKALIAEMDDEERRAAREGLTEEELAVFDLLTKPEPKLTKAQELEVKRVAREVLLKLHDGVHPRAPVICDAIISCRIDTYTCGVSRRCS